MSGLRKVLESISSEDKVDKATQTTKRSTRCRKCKSRGHIYEDHRDTRSMEDAHVGPDNDTASILVDRNMTQEEAEEFQLKNQRSASLKLLAEEMKIHLKSHVKNQATQVTKCHLKDQDSLEDLINKKVADMNKGTEEGPNDKERWMEWRCVKCSKTHALVLAET